VLITSRSQAWHKVVNVDVFSVEASVVCIDNHINESDRIVKEALAVALNILQLAPSHAVAYMRKVGKSVSEYLDMPQSSQMMTGVTQTR
jgi:hypothetical protein